MKCPNCGHSFTPTHNNSRFATFVNEALVLWNELRQPNWVAHRQFTSRAQGQLKKLYEAYEHPLQALRDALLQAQSEDWVKKRQSVTFDEIGSNDKLPGFTEKWRHAHQETAVQAEGFKTGQPVLYLGAKRGVLRDKCNPQYGDWFVLLDDGSKVMAYTDELEAA